MNTTRLPNLEALKGNEFIVRSKAGLNKLHSQLQKEYKNTGEISVEIDSSPKSYPALVRVGYEGFGRHRVYIAVGDLEARRDQLKEELDKIQKHMQTRTS